MNQDFLQLKQPEEGYRYNIDSFLLAHFARFQPGDEVADLGCGVGILSFLALKRFSVKRALGIEVQEELGYFAEQNALLLGLQDQFQLFHSNWKQCEKLLPAHQFDVVVSNPPYKEAKSGRLPPHTGKAIARHEIEGTLPDLIAAAKHLLKKNGRLYLMYPPLRLEELIQVLTKFGFKLSRMAWVHPYLDQEASLVLIEAQIALRRELHCEAPIVVYRDPDHYTPQVEEWVGPKRRQFK